MDKKKKSKFADGFSELAIAKLRDSGEENQEVKFILQLENSFTPNDIVSLENNGLKINVKAKNYVLGAAKVRDISKITSFDCVKNLEVSQKAKRH